MGMSERQQRIIDEVTAASWVQDGMTIAVGSPAPMALVRQLIRGSFVLGNFACWPRRVANFQRDIGSRSCSPLDRPHLARYRQWRWSPILHLRLLLRQVYLE